MEPLGRPRRFCQRSRRECGPHGPVHWCLPRPPPRLPCHLFLQRLQRPRQGATDPERPRMDPRGPGPDVRAARQVDGPGRRHGRGVPHPLREAHDPDGHPHARPPGAIEPVFGRQRGRGQAQQDRHGEPRLQPPVDVLPRGRSGLGSGPPDGGLAPQRSGPLLCPPRRVATPAALAARGHHPCRGDPHGAPLRRAAARLLRLRLWRGQREGRVRHEAYRRPPRPREEKSGREAQEAQGGASVGEGRRPSG
mmetsp:Transcript_110829/g.294438  ORF Transcript_110829/g.294438 Transcript_110829/m.294438 type:complete len:250 (+) Transcript_110829:242-991(+)